MAMTHAVTLATPYSLAYLVTTLADASVTDIITQAEMAADSAVPGGLTNGIVKTLLTAVYANQAAVQASLQGIGLTFSQAAQTPYCRVRWYQVSGTIGSLAVFGDMDAVSATKAEMNLIAPDVAAVYRLEFRQVFSPQS